MSFTERVTPSIYQLNKNINNVLPLVNNLTTLEDGRRVLADNGQYIYLNEPGQLNWFASTAIPKTHLPLFGQILNRYTYTDLFEACTESSNITISNISNVTYLTYSSNTLSLTVGQLLTLESTEDISSVLDTTIPYYITNIDTTNKRIRISTSSGGTPISLSSSDISSITGEQKIRLYTNDFIMPGDYSTTFQLLDARNYFLRCKTDNRTIGSKQEDAFQGHWHFNVGTIYSLNGNGSVADAGTLNRQVLVNTAGTVEVSGESYGSPRVANETRGKNIAAYLCISF